MIEFHLYFYSLLFYFISFILKSNSDIIHYHLQQPKLWYFTQFSIFSSFQASILFQQIAIILIFGCFLVSKLLILIFRQGLILWQISAKILFPIQVYLTISIVKNSPMIKSDIIICSILTTLSILLVIKEIILFKYRFKNNYLQNYQSSSKVYDLCWQLVLIYGAVSSFVINENTKLAILIGLFILNVVKTGIFISRVIYQSPIMQYCGCIGQISSWISLIVTILKIYFGINISLMQWVIYIIGIGLLIKSNKQLIKIVQNKYLYELKRLSLNNIKEGTKHHLSQIQHSLIVKFSIIVAVQQSVNQKLNTLQQSLQTNKKRKYFIQFSQSFIHQIRSIILVNENKSPVLNGLTSQHNDKVWSYLKSSVNLSIDGIKQFHRYLLYNLPNYNSISHFALIRIFYSCYKDTIKHENNKMIIQQKGYVDNVHQKLDYRYLRQKLQNSFYVERKDISPQISITSKACIFGYKDSCVEYEQERYFTRRYQQFCQYFQLQQQINRKMAQFIEVEYKVIQVISAMQSKYKPKIFNLFIRRNAIKKQVIQFISDYQRCVRSISGIILNYLCNYHILKLPYVAMNRFERQIQEYMQVYKSIQSDSNKFIIVVSGVDNQGKIIQSCNVFKRLMQVTKKDRSSINNKLNDSNNELSINEDSSNKNMIEKNSNESNLNKLDVHVNEIMLPYYAQKHHELISVQNKHKCVLSQSYDHVKKGMFISSMIQKKIYQIQLSINYVSCSIGDLYLVLDMSYKKVQQLRVYKNDMMIYQKLNKPNTNNKTQYKFLNNQNDQINQNKQTKQNNKSKHKQIKQKNQHNKDYNQQQLIKSKIYKETQTIFGQLLSFQWTYYQHYQNYSSNNQLQIRSHINKNNFHSNQQLYNINNYSSTTKLQSTYQQPIQLNQQIKFKSYRQKHFFFYHQFIIFSLILFISPFIFTLITYVLSTIDAQNQQGNKNFYITNHNIQDQFFLTDMKSFNIFYALAAIRMPFIKFKSIKDFSDFYSIWTFNLDQQAKNLQLRGIKVAIDLIKPNIITPFLFTPIASNQSSFLYRKQKYDANILAIFNQLGQISSLSKLLKTGQLSANTLNSAASLGIQNFYRKNLPEYSVYTKPQGIFSSLYKLSAQRLKSQKILFSYICYGLLIMSVFGGISYLMFFLDLQKKILKFVQLSLKLDNYCLYKMKDTLNLFNQILKTSHLSQSTIVVKKIKTGSTLKTIRYERNHLNSINKRHKYSIQIEQYQFNVLKYSYRQIGIFLIIVIGFASIIYSNQTDTVTQIQRMQQYLSGSKQLIQLTGKTLYVFNGLLDGLLSSSRPLNKQIPSLIQQILTIDRMKILQQLFDTDQNVYKMAFGRLCITQPDINCMKDKYFNQTYMETMSHILKISDSLYLFQFKNGKFANISSQPMTQIYKQVNLMVKMVRVILQRTEQNFFESFQKDANFYIYIVLGYLLIYELVLGIFNYREMYIRMRRYYEQVLSLVPYESMNEIAQYHFYLNDAQRKIMQNTMGKIN